MEKEACPDDRSASTEGPERIGHSNVTAAAPRTAHTRATPAVGRLAAHASRSRRSGCSFGLALVGLLFLAGHRGLARQSIQAGSRGREGKRVRDRGLLWIRDSPTAAGAQDRQYISLDIEVDRREKCTRAPIPLMNHHSSHPAPRGDVPYVDAPVAAHRHRNLLSVPARSAVQRKNAFGMHDECASHSPVF